MSVRRLFSLTTLGLAGIVSPFLAAHSACAGEKIQFSIAGLTTDKIEFTAPKAPIDVPDMAKDEKDTPKIQYHEANTADRLFFEDNMQAATAAPDVIIVSGSKRGHGSSDTPDLDPDNNDPDSYNSYDHASYRRASVNGPTNQWDAARQWTPDAGVGQTGITTEPVVRPDGTVAGLDSFGSADKYDYRKEVDAAWKNPNSTDSSKWSMSYLHHDTPSYEKIFETQFMPSYQQMLTASQAGEGSPLTRPFGAPDDTLQNATTPVGVSDFRTPQAFARDQTPDATLGTVPTYQYQAPQNRSSGQRPSTYGWRQPDSGSLRNQEPPAILPIPKRPGDVLN